MFFLSRLLRNSTHPALTWGVVALLAGAGVALIVWGLLDHSPIIAVRGLLELVIVGLVLVRVLGPRGNRGGDDPSQRR